MSTTTFEDVPKSREIVCEINIREDLSNDFSGCYEAGRRWAIERNREDWAAICRAARIHHQWPLRGVRK